MAVVPIVYFSDVLCIWAYLAELRIDAVTEAFGDQVSFDYRFCSVFGDTSSKIPAAWAEKGMSPRPYAAGTWGPSAAIALAERDGVSWHE